MQVNYIIIHTIKLYGERIMQMQLNIRPLSFMYSPITEIITCLYLRSQFGALTTL